MKNFSKYIKPISFFAVGVGIPIAVVCTDKSKGPRSTPMGPFGAGWHERQMEHEAGIKRARQQDKEKEAANNKEEASATMKSKK